MNVPAPKLKRLAMLLSLLFAVSPAAAVEPLKLPPELAATNPIAPQTVSSTAFVRTIQLRNNNPSPTRWFARATMQGPELAPIAVRMEQVVGDTAAAFPADGAKLEGFEPLVIRVRAELPSAGDHVLLIEVRPEGGDFQTFSAAVKRTAPTLPATGVFQPPITTAITRDRCPELFCDATAPAIAIAFLPQAEPLTLTVTSPQVARKSSGGGETGTDLALPFKTSCKADVGTERFVLGASPCSLKLDASDLPAGDFIARFQLSGPDQKPQTLTVPIQVREPWWIAAGLLLLGMLFGGVLSYIRDVRAPAIALRMQMRSMLDKAEMLVDAISAGGQTVRAAAIAPLLQTGRDLMTGIEADRAGKDWKPELADFETRQKGLWQIVQQAARAPSTPAVSRLVIDALSATAAGPVGTIQPALEALRAEIDQAVAGFAGESTQVAVPLPSDSGLPQDASLAVLEAKRRQTELLDILLSVALVLPVGILALWVPDATWGTISSKLLAAFAGAAVFGTAAAVITAGRTAITAAGRP